MRRGRTTRGRGRRGWKACHASGRVLGGNCGNCAVLPHGDLVELFNQAIPECSATGGYARGDDRQSERFDRRTGRSFVGPIAAPLVCAGLPPQRVAELAGGGGRFGAVFGVGVLGHLGVQYVITWDSSRRDDRGNARPALKKISARITISTARLPTSPKSLQERGGAQLVLATVSGGQRSGRPRRLATGCNRDSLVATTRPIELSHSSVIQRAWCRMRSNRDSAVGDCDTQIQRDESQWPQCIKTLPLERAARRTPV